MSAQARRALRVGAAAATVTACLAAATIPVLPALGDDAQTSGEARSVHVTGRLTLKDAKTGAYTATGDLQGVWTIPPKKAYDYYNTATTVLQKGPESFAGCLKTDTKTDPKRCGTLNSEYISWSYLKPSGRLISGGCVHAPTGGTRGFVGVRGLLMMTDTPVGDDVVTIYTGDLIVDAKPGEGPMRIPDERVAASAAKADAGSC